MSDTPVDPTRQPNGRFAQGNPGKRKGTRNRTTLAMEKLLDSDAKALTRKAIEMAKAGDQVALRMVLERLLPPRKDRPIRFALPSIRSAADHPAALAAVAEGVAAGHITPSEGQAFAMILEQHRKAVETAELEARIVALEGKPEA
jgi:hypothetical protein